jgi:hypothetical protein
MTRARDVANNGTTDIIPLDPIYDKFDGLENRFQPLYQGNVVSITNPLRLLVTVDGIIQTVDFGEVNWQSLLPRNGFRIDDDGYIAFTEIPPAGSSCDIRIFPGPAVNIANKFYPFRPMDIFIGA